MRATMLVIFAIFALALPLAGAQDITINLTLDSIPVVSSIAVSAAESSAVMTWQTDIPADSQVEYGTDESYGSMTELDPGLVTEHSVIITGLSTGTLYHFRILSAGSTGTIMPSKDGTFTTSSPPAPAPPAPVSSGGGGGGSSRSTARIVQTAPQPVPDVPGCTESWFCTEWSGCVDGVQTRTCTDLYMCRTETGKPAESQQCAVAPPPISTAESFLLPLTGLAAGSASSVALAASAVVLVAAALWLAKTHALSRNGRKRS